MALNVHIGEGGQRGTRLDFQLRVKQKMIPKMKTDPEKTKEGEAKCPVSIVCKFINKKNVAVN